MTSVGRLILSSAFAAIAGAAGAGATPLSSAAACDEYAGLKRHYLDCERAALSETLGTAEIAACSVIYYDLKDDVFDGNAAELREWYRTVQSLGLMEIRAVQSCSAK